MKNLLLAFLFVASTPMAFAQQEMTTQGNFERTLITESQQQFLEIAENLKLLGDDNVMTTKIIERVQFTEKAVNENRQEGRIQLSEEQWQNSGDAARNSVVKAVIQYLRISN